jgi:hypothetical protein
VTLTRRRVTEHLPCLSLMDKCKGILCLPSPFQYTGTSPHDLDVDSCYDCGASDVYLHCTRHRDEDFCKLCMNCEEIKCDGCASFLSCHDCDNQFCESCAHDGAGGMCRCGGELQHSDLVNRCWPVWMERFRT